MLKFHFSTPESEIADILKQWISEGKFLLGEPQFTLPSV